MASDEPVFPNFNGNGSLPSERRHKRAKFWHKTYMEVLMEILDKARTAEEASRAHSFATKAADAALKEMIARGLV